MNKERRAKLAEAITLLEQASAILEEVSSDEAEAYENLPESLQNGDRGEKMNEAVGDIEATMEEIMAQIEAIQDVIDR